MNRMKTILYIEDDANSRLLLKSVLERNNFKILEAEDGLSGIDIVKNNNINLILLDINLPDMNGFEIATKIKSLNINIPLIALTSMSVSNAKELSLISGCDGFIQKPINTKKIANEIKEYLDGKKEIIQNEKMIELMREYNFKLITHLENQIFELKKANESLSTIDKMKTEFISIVSHELKTPLVSIIGFIDLLLKRQFGAITKEQEDVLKIIEKNARHFDKIVRDMSLVSLIDKKVPFVNIKSKVSLNKIFEKVLNYSESLFKENKIQVKYFEDSKNIKIYCDEEKIITALNNIFYNSINFSDQKGCIYVNLLSNSLRAKNDFGLSQKDYIEISIEDKRLILTNEQMLKVFEKFGSVSDVDRISSSQKNMLIGEIGLGLSITRGIILSHNGYIWIEKVKTKGAKLFILLPKKIIN